MSQFKSPPVPGVGVGIGADNNWRPDINQAQSGSPSTQNQSQNPESVISTSSNHSAEPQPTTTSDAAVLELQSDDKIYQTTTGIRTSSPPSAESSKNVVGDNNNQTSKSKELRSSTDRPLESTPGATSRNVANIPATTSTTTGAAGGTSESTVYPEQKHAGKVGYGPNYKPPHSGPSFSDKLGGGLEVLKGKILHKPEVIKHGELRKTGALEEMKKEKDDAENPFEKGAAAEGTEAKKIASGEKPEKVHQDSQKHKASAAGN